MRLGKLLDMWEQTLVDHQTFWLVLVVTAAEVIWCVYHSVLLMSFFFPHSTAFPICVCSFFIGLTWWGTVRLVVWIVATMYIYFTYSNLYSYSWTKTWYNLQSGKMSFVFEHTITHVFHILIFHHTNSFSHIVFRVSCEENGTSGRCYEVVSIYLIVYSTVSRQEISHTWELIHITTHHPSTGP